MKFKSLFRRGQQGKQEPALKGAPSVSSLDSKHHKVAPARDKPLKIFGSKEKLHKAHKKREPEPVENNAVEEECGPGDADGVGGALREYGSAEELGSRRGSQECVSLPVTLDPHMHSFHLDLRPRPPSEVRLALFYFSHDAARPASLEFLARRRPDHLSYDNLRLLV